MTGSDMCDLNNPFYTFEDEKIIKMLTIANAILGMDIPSHCLLFYCAMTH